jgi:hypothetical protein
MRGALLAWLLIAPLGKIQDKGAAGAAGREWLRAFRWDRVLHETLRNLGGEPSRSHEAVNLVETLIGYGAMYRAAALGGEAGGALLGAWVSDDLTRRLLQVNEFEGAWWIGKEPWEALLAGLAAAAELESAAEPALASREREKQIHACRRLAAKMTEAARAAGYRIDRLTAGLSVETRGGGKRTGGIPGRTRPAARPRSAAKTRAGPRTRSAPKTRSSAKPHSAPKARSASSAARKRPRKPPGGTPR